MWPRETSEPGAASLCGRAGARAVRDDGTAGLPLAGAVARNPAVRADPAQRRGWVDPSHCHSGQSVRRLRLPADHGAVAESGLAGGEGPGAMHLAARRAESTRQTKTEKTIVAGGRFVCAAATGASESCVELRFCECHDPRRKGVAHSDAD